MSEIKQDQQREQRITSEIIVDAHDEVERAQGWYYYREDKLHFPFRAKVVAKRLISPLAEREIVQVEAMAPEDECMHEMFVEVAWQGRKLAVPLSQLQPIKVDIETREAVEDWHYWVARGYQF
ncbi:MAG: calcium-binding protein [Phycisphaerae bacterium]